MATSIRNSSLTALFHSAMGILLAAGLLGVAGAAPAPCAAMDIVLEAKPLAVDYRNNNAVLRDVTFTQCDVRILAGGATGKGGGNFVDG